MRTPMATDQEITEDTEEPTSLRFVGPETAAVIDRAAFDLVDVAAMRVSYRDLVDAGVDLEVAERLRRQYSLVWSFEWIVGGDDLPRRAARLRELDPAERSWIAASAEGAASEPDVEFVEADRLSVARSAGAEDEGIPLLERGWPAVDPDEQLDGVEPGVCPRCDAELVTYALDQNESTFCEACGYVGIAADLGGETPVWKAAAERLLSGK